MLENLANNFLFAVTVHLKKIRLSVIRPTIQWTTRTSGAVGDTNSLDFEPPNDFVIDG